MIRRFILFLTFLPMLVSENCTILWNLNDFRTQMQIKMCVSPMQEDNESWIVSEIESTYNLINFTNSTAFNYTNKTLVNVTEKTLTFPISPSPLTTDENFTEPSSVSRTRNLSPSPSVFKTRNPSPVVVAPSIFSTSPSSNKQITPSIVEISQITDHKAKQNNLSNNLTMQNSDIQNNEDNTAIITIIIILSLAFFVLMIYMIKKRKRKHVKPLCTFKKKKKGNPLDRPKDYILEFFDNPMPSAPPMEEKDKSVDDEKAKKDKNLSDTDSSNKIDDLV